MEEVIENGEAKGVVERLWKVMLKPTEAFSYLKRRPTILTPLLLRMGTLLVFIVAGAPLTARIAVEQLSKQGGQMTQQELEGATQMIHSPLLTVVSVVGGLIGLLVIWFIQAGVFNLVGSAWGDSQGYKVSLSLVGHAWMPLIIQQILQSLSVIISGEMVRPGLSALLAAQTITSPTPLSVFLSYVDIFSAWNLVLLIMGISVVHSISRRRSAVLVLGYWLVAVFIAIAVSSLQGLAAGAGA